MFRKACCSNGLHIVNVIDMVFGFFWSLQGKSSEVIFLLQYYQIANTACYITSI